MFLLRLKKYSVVWGAEPMEWREIMLDVHIKVTTDTLLSVSAEVEEKVKRVQEAMEEIDGIVGGSGFYWEGSGQSRYNNFYHIRKDDYMRILNSFREHIINLHQIAGVYQAAESQAVSYIQPLMGDVII